MAIDVGGVARGFGRQAEMKFQTLIEGKLKMGYDAIAFGVTDLRLPAGELVAVAAGVNGKPSVFVSANVGLLGKPGEIVPTSRVIEAGGMKLGVTAILGKQYQKTINNPEIEMGDPAAALQANRARVEAEGRLPGALGPRHNGGIGRAGQRVPRVQRGCYV